MAVSGLTLAHVHGVAVVVAAAIGTIKRTAGIAGFNF
jgi:hypothetical protein